MSCTQQIYLPEPAPADWQPFRFGGKEFLSRVGFNIYDFGARMYSTNIMRWMSMDPLAEKYYDISPYVYCAGNPMNLVDPTGLSTYVYQNEDGTYTVTREGDPNDNDNGVYVGYYDSDGNWVNTGEMIGETISPYSFYNTDNQSWAVGSIIDLKNDRGEVFLSDLINNPPPLIDYMNNARNGKIYDFKVTDGMKDPPEKLDHYRGMLIGDGIIASARDIGNMGAGYISAINDIPFFLHRVVCDLFQTISTGRGVVADYNNFPFEWQIEGTGSNTAQKYGWDLGRKKRP